MQAPDTPLTGPRPPLLARLQGWGYYEAAEQKAAVPIPIVLSAYWKKGAAQPEDDWEDKSFRLAEIVERDAKARAAAGPHNFESYAEVGRGWWGWWARGLGRSRCACMHSLVLLW